MPFDYRLLTIEMIVAALGLIVLVLGLIAPENKQKGLGPLTVMGFLGALAAAMVLWNTQGTLFDGMFVVDKYAAFFKILCLSAAVLVTLGCTQYVRNMGVHGEYYAMIVFAALGMCVMASAGDFITLYLGLELMTIAFIILVAVNKRDGKAVEAGMKYLVLAGLSSAALLYGLSLVYGMTGTIMIYDIARLVAAGSISPVLIFALVLLVAGLGFKVSVVPFHMWAPDIYHGAPTPVTAFLAVGSKAASFAVLLRLFVAGLAGMAGTWIMPVAVLAALTMVIGNLLAIPQTNIKRMLAYSSIAQAGYILVGLVAANESGIKGVMFYSFLYVFATMGAFVVVAAVYNKIKSEEIADYAGLAQRAPLLAAVLTISMLSMAGIPPLAGFVGKFYLFKTIISGYFWLALLGLIMSMISVYYYLRVCLVMYRDDPKENTPIEVSGAVAVVLLVAMIGTMVIGIYPGPLSEVVNTAAGTFFLH
ncbi:NADH-quinone oxidoreductase subunit N [Desulfohalotomaculum tongense]|uniref:NADH-quinone oxidoreductase subunit N n=1 Tax=Desulforadius tongensis TaxID=1216062 RepID=UPI00195E1133|nr:NADH-quinone oxidoreductase subunit N [Desulforadius tongensis]MBM7854356.1 NADH-quinone oxidoreductase subunit N [Desulforadius tongensis]